MKIVICIVTSFCLLYFNNGNAQIQLKHDTLKISEFFKIADNHKKNFNYDSSLFYLNKGLKLSKQAKLKKQEALAFGKLGIVYSALSDFDNSLLFHKNSLTIKQQLNDKKERFFYSLFLNSMTSVS